MVSISLIGSYPPRYGGISIHIQRLYSLLSKQEGVDRVRVYDLHGLDKNNPDDNIVCVNCISLWLLKYIIFPSEDVIHIHAAHWALRFLLGLIALHKNKTVITTLHGDGFINATQKHPVGKKILLWSLNKSKHIICVNEKIKSYLLNLGINAEKLQVVPAFLPPTPEDSILTTPIPKLDSFLNQHKTIISVNASRLWVQNGSEVYGVDMCVNIMPMLLQQYPDIGLVICLAEYKEEKYYSELLSLIDTKNLKDSIYITPERTKFIPILNKSDLFLRPTNTDGDALSIREALSFGVPVIASDVVARPDGCITFKTRDGEDFQKVVLETLRNLSAISSELKQKNNEKNIRTYPLITLYNEIVQDKY